MAPGMSMVVNMNARRLVDIAITTNAITNACGVGEPIRRLNILCPPPLADVQLSPDRWVLDAKRYPDCMDISPELTEKFGNPPGREPSGFRPLNSWLMTCLLSGVDHWSTSDAFCHAKSEEGPALSAETAC